jgi:8-oxo-dGTP diphosphatase
VDLIPQLTRYRPQRILSSPYVRCCETVLPLAESLLIPVESVDELAEGNGDSAVALMRRMAGESAVLCTHGDVATELLEFLAPDATPAGRAALKLQKGEVWVINAAGSTLAIAEHMRRTGGSSRSS